MNIAEGRVLWTFDDGGEDLGGWVVLVGCLW
jgi:hypothetical protein